MRNASSGLPRAHDFVFSTPLKLHTFILPVGPPKAFESTTLVETLQLPFLQRDWLVRLAVSSLQGYMAEPGVKPVIIIHILKSPVGNVTSVAPSRSNNTTEPDLSCAQILWACPALVFINSRGPPSSYTPVLPQVLGHPTLPQAEGRKGSR